jgi:hypothetical protein
MVNVIFGPCCFCGKEIQETDVDPCEVTVTPNGGKWQSWSCHAKCFRERLADPYPDAPGSLDPAHF